LDPISKTICLGVIVLALQVLRGLKFPRCPRIIFHAARALGVSRKAGYYTARRIRAILEKGPIEGRGEELREENLRLRIRNEILTFERDHPGVRFADRHAHLPPDARSLCVRLYRDFKGQLTNLQIAEALGVPIASLFRWCSEADDQAQFPVKPERRGIYRRAGPEDIQRVIEEYKSLTADTTLEEFTVSFNKKYPANTLDRRTITRILQANGLRKIEARGGPPPYHARFKVYYPGAQVSIDAKKCDVVFIGEKRQVITLTKEVGIDIATGAILGDAIEKTENSSGVERVLVQMREEYRGILALLSDNGSANRAADADRIFRWDGEGEGRIFSFPYHPWTNGYSEGLNGQFARIVGAIEIDDTSRATIAASVVEIVWRVFIHFHNYSPRERLGGKSPIEYFREYLPKPEEVAAARKGLGAQREKSIASREPHPRLSDPVFRSRVESVLRRHRLPVALDDALNALLPYDDGVIGRASDALFVQSERSGFDERKRTFPYLMGIVRNKQRESDTERLRAEHLRMATARRLAEEERHRKLIEKEKQEEEEDLRVRPEKVILWNCEMLLRGSLRLAQRRWLEGMRGGLEALGKLGRATRAVLDEMAATIRSWGKYREELRATVAKLLLEEAERIGMAPT
jgi:transposase InsO family protein